MNKVLENKQCFILLVQLRKKTIITLLVVLLCFILINFTLSYNPGHQYPHKTIQELTKLQSLFHNYLVKDLSSTERDIFRNNPSFRLPVLSNNHETNEKNMAYVLNLNPYRRKVLNEKKLVLVQSNQMEKSSEEQMLRILDLLYHPSYQQGWEQYRSCIEFLASCIRKSLRSQGIAPEDFFYPVQDRLSKYRDHQLLKKVFILTTNLHGLKSSHKQTTLSYDILMAIQNDSVAFQPVLNINAELQYLHRKNKVLIILHIYDTASHYLGKATLYDMEFFLNHTDMEFDIPLI